MHYHLELVIPETDNIELAVKQVMAQFDENGKDEDGEPNHYDFWDFYVIGGRWAGAKQKAALDQEKLEAFNQELIKRKVTVAGLQAGKQQISPASQIPMVDELWGEFFPELKGKPCLLFAHSNDQYKSDSLIDGDILRLSDAPQEMKCSRIIFAATGDDGEMKPTFMLSEDFYNGVNYQDSTWDGTLKQALEMFTKKINQYADTYKEKVTPRNNWLVVTVDYHS